MIRHLLAVGALAGALLFVGGAPRLAEALPISSLAASPEGGLTLVRGGFGGRGGGFGGRVGGFGGRVGGGVRSFSYGGGGGVRNFSRGGIGRGVPRFSGRGYGYHHRGHRRGGHIRVYPGYYGYAPYYYDDYYYDGDGGYAACAWLRHKALRSGSRYWWRRYHRCVAEYY